MALYTVKGFIPYRLWVNLFLRKMIFFLEKQVYLECAICTWVQMGFITTSR